MYRKLLSYYPSVALFSLGSLFLASPAGAEPIIADHNAVSEFESIPDSVIQAIGDDFLIFYGHTSHGSQIVTGINLLYNEDPFYDPPPFHEYGDDLGHNGDVSWVPPTRNWLDAHPEYNVVMWSWCGGCSDNTEEGINIYLDAMNGLEQDYPGVIFIYMTGHLDGSGPEGNLYARNNQIRDYCVADSKILFDFADIESYDPDGNYYPDGGDGCEWCYDWCAIYPCPDCGCAHSHCFNCYLKGKAWWWMMARIWGWNSEQDSIPHIISTFPAQNELNVTVSTNISVAFDIPMDETTINDSTFVVNAWSTGLHEGTIIYNSGTRTATFYSVEDFVVGEIVTVVLTTDIQSSLGFSLDSSYLWSFTTEVSDESPGTFFLPVNYQAGDGPAAIFCADLDGDTDLDLALANDWSDDVSILKNNGDGSFQDAVSYDVGDEPLSVFCADLDGDTDMDLAVANSSSRNVSVLKNNGDGSFQSAVNYGTDSFSRSVFCADLDGDIDLDLAVANFAGDNVSILKNNGDGSFQSAVECGAGNSPFSVFSADLDGDGDLDLAVTSYGNDSVSILKNNGDGSFQSPVNYGTRNFPISVFCADLDGDTDLDIAVANYVGDNVSILFNCLPTGDCNGDEVLDGGDLVYLLNYLYRNGPAPDPFEVAGVNCDEIVGPADVVYLINYFFKNGPPPCCLVTG